LRVIIVNVIVIVDIGIMISIVICIDNTAFRYFRIRVSMPTALGRVPFLGTSFGGSTQGTGSGASWLPPEARQSE